MVLADSRPLPVDSLIHIRLVAENDYGTNYSQDALLHTLDISAHGAVQLNGTNDYILSPDLHTYLVDDSLTIELWFKAEAPGILVDERGQSPTIPGWQFSLIEVESSGAVLVRVFNMNAVTVGKVNFGEWHHVTLRYNKAILTLDGLLDGVPSGGSSIGDRAAPAESGLAEILGFGLGDSANMGSGANFKGQLDDVRIWNVARTTQDIQANLGSILTGAEHGLIAYWRFDEAPTTSAFDFSDNGNDGLFAGLPTPTTSDAPLQQLLASTQPATVVSPYSALLNGRHFEVFPGASTYFEWGNTTNVPNSTRRVPISDPSPNQPISANLSGLSQIGR